MSKTLFFVFLLAQLSQQHGPTGQDQGPDDGPPRTKSARLEKFRRCKSFDWDHFRNHCSSGDIAASEVQDPSHPLSWDSDHKSVQKTWSGGSSSSSGGGGGNNNATYTTSSAATFPTVSTGDSVGNPRSGGDCIDERRKVEHVDLSSSSLSSSSRTNVNKPSSSTAKGSLIKNLGESAESQGLHAHCQHSTTSVVTSISSTSSSNSSISSAARYIHDSSTTANVIRAATTTFSPPASPRRFGLRAAMPNIFSFGKDKIMSVTGSHGNSGKLTGAQTRKKDPPTHLNLFGALTTSSTSVAVATAPTQYSPPDENTVFEKTVCKRCALLMPQLATGQDENKPELMQQQTQTDFSLLEETIPEQDAMGSYSTTTAIATATITTTSVKSADMISVADSTTDSPVNNQSSTKPVAYVTTTIPTTATLSAAVATTTTIPVSGTSTMSSSSMYICQKHQEKLLQQPHGPTPILSTMPTMPEKKYVPSPLAQENRKSTPSAQPSSGSVTYRASEQCTSGPNSPGPSGTAVSSSSSSPQHYYHQHQHHHLHHVHQQYQAKKHSLAYSLPIPQVALQYANIPSGDTPTPNSSMSIRPATSAKDSLAATVTSAAAAAVAEGRGKSSTLPTIDSKHIVAIRSAEKRRRFFAKKQTNSAPDTFDSHTFLNATQGVLHTTSEFVSYLHNHIYKIHTHASLVLTFSC